MKPDYREFDNRAALEAAALDLLREAFRGRSPSPRAVMLTGGKTPFGVYDALAAEGWTADPAVSVFLSDDRMAPVASPASNYGRLMPMLAALSVPGVYVPDGRLEAGASARRYDDALTALLADRAVPVSLGILGLGADGHVAGLFHAAQWKAAPGRRAIAVERPDGLGGVSVTPPVLCLAQRLVFWVMGPGKRKAVEALRYHPGRIPAGQALEAAPRVEIWYAPDGA